MDVDYIGHMQHYSIMFTTDLPREIASYETLFMPFTDK